MDRLELRIVAAEPTHEPEPPAVEAAWIDPDELPAGRRRWVCLLAAEPDDENQP